jgi:hypothetical protein
MASSVYKWLAIPLFVSFFVSPAISPASDSAKLSDLKVLHPLHVSVVEVNHNAADKTLEISCKLFTDDFETALAAIYKTKTDLINPKDVKAMDKLVSDYINTHLSIKADGKPVVLSYLGFERENDVVYGYLEVEKISSVKKIEITNKLMYDMFTDQINMMHVIVGGNRKSYKLDYPKSQAEFVF